MIAVQELLDVPVAMGRQYEPRALVRNRQLAGIQQMLIAARESVEYYKNEAYDVRIETLRQLVQLPMIHKNDILAGGEQRFHSSQIGKTQRMFTRTSGTSGRRLNVLHDLRHAAYHNAACLRRFEATGLYRPWFRLVHLRPSLLPNRWYQRLGLFRRQAVLCSSATQDIKKTVLDARPQAIIAYPTMLRALIRSLDTSELNQLRKSLRLIFTESELLLDEHRQWISDVLGVPIFDEYSAYETLNIGFECSSHFLHVAEDRIFLEIVDEAGNLVDCGKEGTVVVTAFQERAMPLIRYALGDRAQFVPGSCPCGRTFRRITLTSGRNDDHVVLPDGSIVYVATFLRLAAELPGLAESTVNQDAEGRVTVGLMPDGAYSSTFDDLASAYKEMLVSLVGREFPVEFELRDHIDLTPGGKGRFLESALKF